MYQTHSDWATVKWPCKYLVVKDFFLYKICVLKGYFRCVPKGYFTFTYCMNLGCDSVVNIEVDAKEKKQDMSSFCIEGHNDCKGY